MRAARDTVAPATALREPHFYPAVLRFLEHRGFVVEGAVNGRAFPLPLSLQTVDLIGFKKRRDDVQVVGVEVKRGTDRGSIREAMAQAAAYQVVIPEVFVATPAGAREFREIRRHMAELGLGYMRVVQRRVSRSPRPSWPTSSVRCPSAYRTSLRHAALLRVLAARISELADLGGAPWRTHASVWSSGEGARPGGAASWGFGTHSIQGVQIMLDLPADDSHAYATVWTERKPLVRRLLDPTSAREIAAAMERTGPHALEVHRWRRDYRSRPVDRRRFAPTYRGLRAGIRWAGPWLDRIGRVTPVGMRFRLWSRAQPIGFGDAERMLRRLLPQLLQLRAEVARCIRAED